MKLAELLEITPGLTAIIGSGGKTTLLFALARELARQGRVIVTTTTHIWKPADFPFAPLAEEDFPICVGREQTGGKLAAPAQTMEELLSLGDYVLVEADGSAGRPIKAHAAHEPVIPPQANQVICVVGASGLNSPIEEVVHRPELFYKMTESSLATPEAVASVLEQEKLFHRLVINQAETNQSEARTLASLISQPAYLATLQKGEIQCVF